MTKKQTVYLPEAIASDVRDEALRLDRSVSSLLQIAWRLARRRVAAMPADEGEQATLPKARA